jgi:hypothetical protein
MAKTEPISQRKVLALEAHLQGPLDMIQRQLEDQQLIPALRTLSELQEVILVEYQKYLGDRCKEIILRLGEI